MLSKVDLDLVFKPAFRCPVMHLDKLMRSCFLVRLSSCHPLFHYRSTQRSSYDAIILTFPSTDNTVHLRPGPPNFHFGRRNRHGEIMDYYWLPPPNAQEIASAPLKKKEASVIESNGTTLIRGRTGGQRSDPHIFTSDKLFMRISIVFRCQ